MGGNRGGVQKKENRLSLGCVRIIKEATERGAMARVRVPERGIGVIQ